MQGFILGGDLWKISYDDILKLQMPDDTSLVGWKNADVASLSGSKTRGRENRVATANGEEHPFKS